VPETPVLEAAPCQLHSTVPRLSAGCATLPAAQYCTPPVCWLCHPASCTALYPACPPVVPPCQLHSTAPRLSAGCATLPAVLYCTPPVLLSCKQVPPANKLPRLAKRIVVVNLQWTPLAPRAHLKIHGRLDQVLTRAAEVLGVPWASCCPLQDPFWGEIP